MIQNVRQRVPGVRLAAFSINPADTRERHGIPAYPLRAGTGAGARPGGATSTPPAARATRPDRAREALRRVPVLYRWARAVADGGRRGRGACSEAFFWVERYRRLRGIDLVIVAGSNQLSDYVGGAWGFPYTIWAWTVAARAAGARVAFLSVGAGPIRSGLSRAFVRAALTLATYRSYRDEGSRETVANVRAPAPYVVAPDLAHSLKGIRVRSPRRVGRSVQVAINPLPYFDSRFWAESDDHLYDRYVQCLADFAAWLLDQGDAPRFVPTQLRADPPVITDVLDRLETRIPSLDRARMAPPVLDFDGLVDLLSEADFVVATRFHGVVLAHILGKPTVAIVYRRSTADLMNDLGQGAYAVDAGRITFEDLRERFVRLQADESARERIVTRVAAYGEGLARQYDQVLGIGSRRTR